MKKTILILTTAALVLLSSRSANAGGREWAVAGGVLTGLTAVSIVSHALAPAPVYYSANYYSAPDVTFRPGYGIRPMAYFGCW